MLRLIDSRAKKDYQNVHVLRGGSFRGAEGEVDLFAEHIRGLLAYSDLLGGKSKTCTFSMGSALYEHYKRHKVRR